MELRCDLRGGGKRETRRKESWAGNKGTLRLSFMGKTLVLLEEVTGATKLFARREKKDWVNPLFWNPPREQTEKNWETKKGK